MHAVKYGDVVPARRAVHVSSSCSVDAAHALQKGSPVAVFSCVGNAQQEDVGVDHFVQERFFEVFRGAQFEDGLRQLDDAAASGLEGARARTPSRSAQFLRIYAVLGHWSTFHLHSMAAAPSACTGGVWLQKR